MVLVLSVAGAGMGGFEVGGGLYNALEGAQTNNHNQILGGVRQMSGGGLDIGLTFAGVRGGKPGTAKGVAVVEEVAPAASRTVPKQRPPQPTTERPVFQKVGEHQAQQPINGQTVLDNATAISGNSKRMIGTDPKTGDIMVFTKTAENAWRGEVRPWKELTPEMQKSLVEAGLAKRNGHLLTARPARVLTTPPEVRSLNQVLERSAELAKRGDYDEAIRVLRDRIFLQQRGINAKIADPPEPAPLPGRTMTRHEAEALYERTQKNSEGGAKGITFTLPNFEK